MRSNRKLLRYLPDAVGRMLNTDDEIDVLSGRAREVSVLFNDVAGYSTISERLQPVEVVQFLNRYFAAMAGVVSDHGGTVIEFTGDGMLVVFGAPVDQPDHATRAVQCGLAMHERLAELNNRWHEDAAAALWRAGMPRVGCRVGVHSGEVVAGNVGFGDRVKYTVVGDAVNVAARLEQLNKSLGTNLLVSGATLAALDPTTCAQAIRCGAHRIRGREQAIEVFAFGRSPDQSRPWSTRIATNHG